VLQFGEEYASLPLPVLRKRGGLVGGAERTTACYEVSRSSSALAVHRVTIER